MAGNEYDALIAESPETQAKAVTNEYDSMVVDFTKERSQRTRASIYGAQDANPDLTAKAISLSKKTGIPVDTVERDVKAVEGPAALNDYDALVQKSPGLGRWLEDPINARVAKDDYESLGLLEKGWNEIKRGFFGQRSDVQALGAAVAGQRGADLDAALGKAERGEYLTPVEKAMIAQAPQVRANVESASTEAIGKLLENKRTAESIPMRPALRELNDAKTWGDAWSALGKDPLGIIFDLTTGNLPQLLTSTAATVIGGPAVGVAAMGGQSFAQEFVGGILDNMQELGVKTDDPEALRAAFANPDLMSTVYRKSTIKASIVGTLDAATMGIAGKTLAPAAVKGRLAREAVNMPAQLATQMAGGAGGEALGSVAAGREVKPGSVLSEAVAELGSAPADVLAMRGFGKAKKPATPEQTRAEVQAMGLDKMVADAQGTKLAARSPEKLAEFLSTVTGPDQNVFVPVEAVQAYFQSKPVEDMQAMSDALGITDQIPEALARGGDVVIPLAKYVTEAGKSDIHKAWRDDVRMEADGFSIRQAQEDAKVRDERLKAAVDRFEKQLDAGIAEVDATTRVYEDLRDKLKTAGKFTNEAAEQQATVFAEHYATRAVRNPGSYLDAWDAYSKAGLGTGMEVQTQLSDRVGAYPPDDLDVLLNSIRSGKVAPTKTDADANAQFLKDREELAGALDGMGVDTKKMGNAQIRAAIKAELEKRKAGSQTYEQPVYHGTPHIFDKFDLSKIGTGEGAQAYGWGLYFAGRKGVAQHYREKLSASRGGVEYGGKVVLTADGKPLVARQEWLRDWGNDLQALIEVAIDGNMDLPAAIAEVREKAKQVGLVKRLLGYGFNERFLQAILDKGYRLGDANKGRLYHVDIPEDGQYLHWDKPLSEQSAGVKKAIKSLDLATESPVTGAEIYGRLVDRFSRSTSDDPEKAASLALREAGVPGIQYLDGGSRGTDKGSHNYVLFDDALATIKQYEQEARGQITFADNLSTITLFQGRDLSTLLHETGHLWLEELGFDAKAASATPQIKADYQAVLDALGSKDGYITRDMHEQWAQWAEQYFMEGKAPSAGLASAFRSFKRWLTQIYRRLTALGAPITPELRQVFDRLIATDEQIETAQTRQGLNPVFRDAESADMTKAEFAAYTARANAVVDEAEQKLLQATMDTIRKQRTKEWKADEARVREEVTGEVMSESGQQALALLTKGEFPVGTTPEVLKGIKLTKEDIVALYGDETVLTMLPAGIYRDRSAGPGAMTPDELAPMLGLDSGKDLIERLMQLEVQHKAMAAKGDKRSVARARIDEETAQRMNERYGDPLNDGTIEQEAMAAVHSDKQAALMATELRVLAKKAGHTGTITWDDIKAWAADAIADKSVREGTKFDQYARAERTAGRKVEQALIKGDFVAAFKAKQDQMVNHALYMEARKASEKIDGGAKRLERYASAATIKSMEQDYLDQIHTVLEGFEFKGRSDTLLAERKAYEVFVAEQKEAGVEIVPPIKGFGLTNYRDMTIDQFLGLLETVEQIAKLGRDAKKVEIDGQKRERDAVLTEMEETAAKGPQRGTSQSVRGKSDIEISVGAAQHFARMGNAMLMKIERLMEFADGDKTGRGIFTRAVYRPMAKADGDKNDRLTQLGKEFKALYDKVPWAQRKRWHERHAVPEVGGKLRKEEIIVAALNMGNESNLEKMLDGNKWSEDGARAMVNKHLTKEEWQFVQDSWNLLESYWPEYSAMLRDAEGVAPPKVDPMPVATPFGTLRGGYYPVDYDRRESLKAAKIGEARDAALEIGMSSSQTFSIPTTRAGSANKRTAFNAPITLDLSVMGKHLEEVIHDITHRRAVASVYKLINNDRFREAMRSRLGSEYEAQFLPWLRRVSSAAKRNNAELKAADAAMRFMRVNTTITAMALRVSTGVQQISGYVLSTQRLGTKYMLKGMAEYFVNIPKARDTVYAMSPFMRNRANNHERDAKAAVDKHKGKSVWKQGYVRWAMRGIALMDLAVSIPTWQGAYMKGLAEGMTEDDAIYYGDKMVRDTQGGGSPLDMAAVQDGSEAMKLGTMFYSFLNVFYNAQQGIVEDTRNATSFSDYADAFWQTTLLMALSPIIAAYLAGQGPGDDEDWLYWAMRQVGFGAFSGIPLVRDMANTLMREFGGQPSSGFKMTPAQGPIEGSLRLVHDLAKMTSGDEPSKSAIKNTFNVAGFFTGLPGGQPGVTAQFLYDALVSGSENPQNIQEWLRGLTYGPKK